MAILVLALSACEKDITEEGGKENLPNISGFPIVGTNQISSFNNSTFISLPSSGEDFYGQNSKVAGKTECHFGQHGVNIGMPENKPSS